MESRQLKILLNKKEQLYNQLSFVELDPISIPHSYSQQQDIEIAGFFAALFSWGNRTIIINKSRELMERMENAPYAFCLQHTAKDLKRIIGFKHRTFNEVDIQYFIRFLNHHYNNNDSLETAFSQWIKPTDSTIENALIGFRNYFFSLPDSPDRTKKHVSTPINGSHCKRLNMYLRWMVRKDNNGVDFGIWNTIKPAQLIIPIDVHVARVAEALGMLNGHKINWDTAVYLTNLLKAFDKNDPVKYDYALFGLGVMEKFGNTGAS